MPKKYHRSVNRVTEQFYNEVKPKLRSTQNYSGVMRKYKISQTTCRAIKNTASYAEYRERSLKSHKPKTSQQLERLVREATYDRPTQPATPQTPSRSAGEKAGAIFLLACLFTIAAGLAIGALRWGLGL